MRGHLAAGRVSEVNHERLLGFRVIPLTTPRGPVPVASDRVEAHLARIVEAVEEGADLHGGARRDVLTGVVAWSVSGAEGHAGVVPDDKCGAAVACGGVCEAEGDRKAHDDENAGDDAAGDAESGDGTEG